MHYRIGLAAGAVALAILAIHPARGGVLLQGDFDTHIPNSSGSAYGLGSGGSDTVSLFQIGSITPSIGVGESAAWQVGADLTGTRYVAFLESFFTDSGIGDYTSPASVNQFGYDASIELLGALPAAGQIPVQIKMDVSVRNSASLIILEHDAVYDAQTGGWQRFTGNFEAADLQAATLADLDAANVAVVAMEMYVFVNDQNMGYDADNVLRVDNIALTETAVPEPASLGLLGVGAVALLRRRR